MVEQQKIAIIKTREEFTAADRIFGKLKDGYDVSLYTLDDDMKKIFSSENKAVILAGADTVSGSVKVAVHKYMENGGRLMLLGGPAFYNILSRGENGWISLEEKLLSAENTDNSQLIINTGSEEEVSALTRVCHDESNPFSYSIDGDWLTVNSHKYKLRDYLKLPFKPAIKNPNVISFFANADDITAGIFVGIKDSDGSFWFARVKLVAKHRRYTITPDDFYLASTPLSEKPKKCDFSKTEEMCFGFDEWMAYPMSYELHAFGIGMPRMYSMPDLNGISESMFIDGVIPDYEQYPVTNAANLFGADNQVFVGKRDYKLPKYLCSCHPRNTATGCRKERLSRFVPLIEISDKKGLFSGYAAWIQFFSNITDYNKSMEGSRVCVFTPSDDFYDENGIEAVEEALSALCRDTLLLEGGSDEYTYIKSDCKEVNFGAAVLGNTDTADKLSVTLYKDGKAIKSVEKAVVSCDDYGKFKEIFESYDLSDGTPDFVEAALLSDGKVVDKLVHEIKFFVPKPLNERRYVYAKDGSYMRDGKVLNLFGVNYVPMYTSAEKDGALREHYVWKKGYDPDLVKKDIEHLKDIGFNAVSVYQHAFAVDSNNMLDLINLMEENGIYVDLGIRSREDCEKEYVYYEKSDAPKLITRQHFYELDNIVAYDINWERGIGNYAVCRKRWDGDWEKWLVDNYGSVAHAEKLFGCSVPKDADGKLMGLDDKKLNEALPEEAPLFSAYYRFVDDKVSEEFTALANYLHSLDPYHLLSFRMSRSGSTMERKNDGYGPASFPYDFKSLASSLDFMSPEGYCLAPNDVSMLQVVFANNYARYTSPDAPVVWKEFGENTWYCSNFIDNTLLLKRQEKLHRVFYEYALRSYTSATYTWFYPSGFRINECSDYGIHNPDGSDRPATAVMREYAEKFKNQGAKPTNKVRVVAAERDDEVRSLFGMFETVKDDLKAAYDNGELIEFVPKISDGKFYADTVLDKALGGVKTEGKYPFKYINGQIKEVVRNGNTAEITVINTEKSVWRKGSVAVVSTDNSEEKVNAVIDSEVGYLDTVKLTVPMGDGKYELRFAIDGKLFGMAYDGDVLLKH